MIQITSYDYRSEPLFLRNQFNGVGMFSMPLIKKQEVRLEDFVLIGYDKINQSNETGKTVHFFLDDYRFESIYKNPDDKMERLKEFNAVLSPDFSMYTEMPVALQLYNCFRNRWTGAYLQQNGITVIPTVRWGSLESFNFCFDGIEKGCVVAVSTLGVKNEKSHFMLGYNEMRRRIKPEKIICYGKPFDDMKGDIIEVDYAETNNLDKGFYIKKFYGFITPIQKGGGSALGRISGNPEHEFDENTDMPSFPGYENKAPGKDFEWRGNPDIKKNIGNWFNKKTGESFHWDMDHPDPIGPHWDYFRRDIDNEYRIFPDNTWSKKLFQIGGCNYEQQVRLD